MDDLTLPNLDSLPLCACGLRAGGHDHLGSEGRLRPGRVELARPDLFREVAKQIHLLSAGVTMTQTQAAEPDRHARRPTTRTWKKATAGASLATSSPSSKPVHRRVAELPVQISVAASDDPA